MSDPIVSNTGPHHPGDRQSDGLSPEDIRVQPAERPSKRMTIGGFSTGVLFNVVIPIALLVGGFLVIQLLGQATPPPRDADDTSRTGRMKALTAVRVARLKSLKATGEQLQLEVDGNVVPFREAQVAAEVAGRVVFKDDVCEAGNVVKKGQVLMRIDSTDYKLEVESLARQKEQAYQSLMEVDQEMVNASRLVKVAQQDVQLQEAEVKRQESLPRGFSSRGEIDQAKRALLQATQQLVERKNQIDLLKKRRVRLEASEKLAATQLMSANLNLDRTEIVAPIDGVIVREDADLNTFVNRGSPLVTIEDTSKVEVATSLRMDQLYWILDQKDVTTDKKNGSYDLPETPALIEYELTGRGGKAYQWQGRLLSYDGIGLDPQTRTIPVRVVVDKPQEFVDASGDTAPSNGATALVRGMYVRVKFLINPKTELVVIPGNALQPGNRVWQFVEDPAVITDAMSKQRASSDTLDSGKTAEGPDATALNEATVAESDQGKRKAESKFNVNDWTPGRVVIQKEIFPVDTLTLSAAMADANDRGSELGNVAQYWVCETRDPNFGHDSYVVTSPVSGVDSKGLPARAEISKAETIFAGDAMTQPEKAESDDPTRSVPAAASQDAEARTAESTSGHGEAA